MSYMVMECGLGYAIVLDSQGRFLKVVNCGYEVGQKVDQVITFEETSSPVVRLRRQISSLAAVAACLCVLLLGSHQFLLTAYGTVRMQINPDVKIVVNRLDYVINLEGINEDGQALVESYRYFGKKLWKVSDELADRALEDGFLKYGGEITLTVESKHEGWKEETEKKLTEDIGSHLPEQLNIKVFSRDSEDDQKQDEERIPDLPESYNMTETAPAWSPIPESSSGALSDMDEDGEEEDDDRDNDNDRDNDGDRDNDDDRDNDGDRDNDDDQDNDDDDDQGKDGDDDGKEETKDESGRDDDDRDDEDRDEEEKDDDDDKRDIDKAGGEATGGSQERDDRDDEDRDRDERGSDQEEGRDDSDDGQENSQDDDDGGEQDSENRDQDDNNQGDDGSDKEDDSQDDSQDDDRGDQDEGDDGDSDQDQEDDSEDD